MSLKEIIINKIKIEGPISFHDFMEMCLYYPELGYYTSSKEKIGRSGDYYTSSYVNNIFGKMIAKQIEEMWQLLGCEYFTMIEFGAGTGALCFDILSYIKEHNSSLYNNLSYYIIEKSAEMKQKQTACLHEKVYWVDSIKDISSITGCIFSNELLDNFSIHRVVMQKELMEIFVDYDDGFIEILRPAASELVNYIREHNLQLPEGFCTEINLQAIKWIDDIAEVLSKGFVLTIDYGFPATELYSEKRKDGTLLCYNKHTVNDLFYDNIGQQDITAHVNFSALHHWGEKKGLRFCGFTNQANFLVSLGLTEYIRKLEENIDKSVDCNMMQLQTLLIEMGKKFKVLAQSKRTDVKLSGMMFSQSSKVLEL
jgi:SAM-dependent MidA family methyltransferase